LVELFHHHGIQREERGGLVEWCGSGRAENLINQAEAKEVDK